MNEHDFSSKIAPISVVKKTMSSIVVKTSMPSTINENLMPSIIVKNLISFDRSTTFDRRIFV